MIKQQLPIIIIGGATASGKTDFALKLAQYYDVEVVSADSRQVYRYMDIGTAKVSADEQRMVSHHLIDVVEPDKDFSVADFTDMAHAAVIDIFNRGKIPLVVGGTGLYLRALTDGLIDAPSENAQLRAELLEDERQNSGCLYQRLLKVDNCLAQTIHPNDITRIVRGLEVYVQSGTKLSQIQQQHAFREQRYRPLKFAPSVDRALLYERINKRVGTMINEGLLRETQHLLKRGFTPSLKSMRTIGYRQAIAHLCDNMSLDDAIAWIQLETRRYAKRQLTWFRKDKTINWVDYNHEFDSIRESIDKFYFN
ncbi:MAG: tRNA (adenosine(37)-N6)-dimethylallyltransferase MiaA [Desulfobacteraceae bacterium 4572_35.1]|nr:MAG: tRNA (adenosine(37)-N6)-dimethylallyltransferase MiaA [Desulfobacteraceae bacterium 4572_35.1]